MTKTEIKVMRELLLTLFTRKSNYISVDGKRARDAAEKLASRYGLTFINTSSENWDAGRYYINPFTRRPSIVRTVFCFGARLAVPMCLHPDVLVRMARDARAAA